MSKYFNILLFSIFGVLSIKLNIGFSLYLPVVMYFILKDNKNILLIIPSSVIACYFFDIRGTIPLVVFYIVIIVYLIISKNVRNKRKFDIKLYDVFILFFINGIICLYILDFKINNLYSFIISLIIAPLILSFFFFNNQIKNNKKGFSDFSNIEFIMFIIISLSAVDLVIDNINIGLILSIYYTMYLASNKSNSSIIYTIIIMICYEYIYEIEYAYLLIIICGLYYIKKYYGIFAFVIYLGYSYFIKDNLSMNFFIILCSIVLIFEMFRPFNEKKNSSDLIINNIYEITKEKVNKETNAFALFLDKLAKDYIDKDYFKELNNCISSLAKSSCELCYLKKDCFTKNKGKLYYYYKDLILNKDNTIFTCHKYSEMRLHAYNLRNRLELLNKSNEIMIPMFMEGISNILREYNVNSSLIEEIEYKKIIDLKNAINDYGYSICYFNVESCFTDNLLIEIGLIGIDFALEKENIELICSNYISQNIKANLKEKLRNKTYFKISIRNKYKVSYGYGSLAQIGNTICGDNYLIKQVDSSKIVAIICDGMGKGMNANIQSSLTIKLLDEITDINISSDTALQILNTFYYIQDYNELYTTLDYIQINENNGTALFYKAGASTSYVFHENGVYDKIYNENLPYGLNEIIQTKKIKLRHNDLIVMSSDGVFENVKDSKELENFIMGLYGMDCQKIAYEILNYARYADVLSSDDMSVIVMRIIEDLI